MLLHPRLCVCVLALSSCYLTILSVAQITDPSEVKALLAIKRALIDPMNHLSSWNKGDPCMSNWTGVFCFHTLGTDEYLHTQELQLLNMNLSGNLAPELGQLSHLEILDFMWNELTGSIPKEMGNISSLRLLLLNGNKLSGSLPEELGYLVNLNRFQLDQNYISGPIPKSFANMSSVRHLHLNNNSISGQIPSELSKLSTLVHLILDNNNLTGHLPPEFSNFPALRILQLDNNNFNGSEIPSTYGNFSIIVKLSLRNCSLRGTIPDFSSLPNLLYLDLSKNNLAGPVPSKLSDKIITIYLSDNHLNRSIPESFSYLPFLQILSLENNLLTGSVPANMWLNISFSTITRLTIDLRNNLLSNILGDLNPPVNVTLRLAGNPICSNANMQNVTQFCRSGPGVDILTEHSTNPMMICPIQACPTDDFFEYVPSSPVSCFCAAPLRIGYRLKSPSFSYFNPYAYSFEKYITNSLNLDLYQVSIDSFSWEKGPRLRMYLKLFPPFTNTHSSSFNQSEVYRIRGIFTTWHFPGDHLFGPYELLNFTLLGPYSGMNFQTRGIKINKGVWAAIVFGTIACALAFSAMVTLLIVWRQNRYKLSKRHSSTKLSIKIDGIKDFKFREMALATDGFNISTQVGQGGYGKVYRGTLADKTVVAIKRAEEGSLQGQKEFLTEIEVLSRLHHRNLVSLVGYCDEEGEQMLVYEFMANGTLRDWLSAKAKGKLNFGLRLSIALCSAKGILYLHNEADPPVFHRDIKASNILLDSQLTAKVADFGLSRLAPVLDDEGNLPNYVSTVVKGTPGYLDPEYLLTHKLTDKSDVYSLGIVFLELLTSMKPISHGKNIVREVNMAHQSGMMFSTIDSRMGSYPSECVERFVGLALQCCHDKPEKRPSMLDVVRELENIVSKMPETDRAISTSTTASTSSYSDRITTPTSNSGKTASSSTSFYRSRDVNWLSGGSASDLVSGVTSTITRR